MKYLKTFEQKMTLDLDKDDVEALLISAIDNNKKNLISEILENGCDPNILIDNDPLLLSYISRCVTDIDFDILKIIIDNGADVNFVKRDKYPIVSDLMFIYDKSIAQTEIFLKVFKILINAGANLLISASDNENYDTFNIIDERLDNDKFSKKTYDSLMKIIEQEAPEQYKVYLMKKNSQKYNL